MSTDTVTHIKMSADITHTEHDLKMSADNDVVTHTEHDLKISADSDSVIHSFNIT